MSCILAGCRSIETGDGLIVGVHVKSNLGDSATAVLAGMAQHYIELKNALVLTNAGAADTACFNMIANAQELKLILAADTVHSGLLSPLLDSVSGYSSKVIAGKNSDCELKRVQFAGLSKNMVSVISVSGLRNVKMYKHYSPMALNEKGAVWLSEDRKRQNPYFGQKMLESGELIDSLN